MTGVALRPMEAAHDVTSFRSGNAELDTWLRSHGLGNQNRYGVTYIATDDTGAVIAFVTVAPISVERKEAGGTTGGPSRWPALLLARMAVAEHLQGQKIGLALLRHVFQLAVQQHLTTGCAAVIVDAKPSAVGFYAKHMFLESPTTKKRRPEDSTRMYLAVETIIDAMKDPDATGSAWRLVVLVGEATCFGGGKSGTIDTRATGAGSVP